MKKQRDDKQSETTANDDTCRINDGRSSLKITQRGEREAHRGAQAGKGGTKQVMKKPIAES